MKLLPARTLVATNLTFVVVLAGCTLFPGQNSSVQTLPAHTAGTITAYIAELSLTDRRLTFDDNTWLQGQAAAQAQLDAGECDVLENCAPDGFFVANPEVRAETAALSDNVRVTVFSKPEGIGIFSDETGVVSTSIKLERLASYLSRPDRNGNLTYELTFNDAGQVTLIAERYQP